MKTHKRRKLEGHVLDTDRDHLQGSYQTSADRQNLRVSSRKNGHNYKREDLGFAGRDVRGYENQHRGKY